jgi:hypothetical protein
VVIDAIKAFKNGKSPGYDNLAVELFNADPGVAATILQPLFTAVG